MAKTRKRNGPKLAALIGLHVTFLSLGIIGTAIGLVFLIVYLIDRMHGLPIAATWDESFFYGLAGVMFFCMDWLLWEHFLKREF